MITFVVSLGAELHIESIPDYLLMHIIFIPLMVQRIYMKTKKLKG